MQPSQRNNKYVTLTSIDREGVSGEARGATAPHRYLEHALTHIKLAKQMDTKFIEKGHQTMYFHKKQIK